jgi:hypothetical protein
MQKYVFISETLKHKQEKTEQALISILKNPPYEKYIRDLAKGITGAEYAEKTILFLKN